MPLVKNLSYGRMILEHVRDEPIVLNPGETVEVPAEALSIPLIRHYLEVKRLFLVPHKPEPASVILSR